MAFLSGEEVTLREVASAEVGGCVDSDLGCCVGVVSFEVAGTFSPTTK